LTDPYDGQKMDELMDDYRDWTITLSFNVPPGDVEGVMTEAILDAARHHAPAEATGMVASADTDEGKVRVVFTLVHSSRGLADEVVKSMKTRVAETVFSGDDACVSAG
jgi:hypothetical protein